MPLIPRTDLQVFPLCLGGNVFGGHSDEPTSFAVLDAYRDGGGNFIDTADVYSAWLPGNKGGESESVLGRWIASRKARKDVIVATKVGKLAGLTGLSAKTIERALEQSLARLGTDYIDLYYAHADDPTVPLEESLHAFDSLVKTGKVRYLAASNYDAPRLSEALAVSKREGLARFVALQNHYNLLERDYERTTAKVVAEQELASFPYFALAHGFLSGKYRPGVKVDSRREATASKYLDARGLRVLAALDELAEAHATSQSAVALAWLRQQPTVTAPIASARTVEQVPALLAGARLELSEQELERLASASG